MRARSVAKRLFSIGLGFLGLIGLVFCIAGLLPLPMPKTASGQPRLGSYYVEAEGGLRIAVRVLLPRELGPDGRVPALMEYTRYGSLGRPSFILKALLRLRLARLSVSEGRKTTAADFFLLGGERRFTADVMREALGRGWAYVAVDARGSGASFGSRSIEWSREEIGDLRSVIDWIAARPWSTGLVSTFGVSVSANYAELALAAGSPALRSAALLYPDFDPVAENARPGGILNVRLCEDWSAANARMDSNEGRGLLWAGTAPVDGFGGKRLLRRALAEHDTADMAELLRKAPYLDDEIWPGYRARDIAPAGYEDAIEASGLPLYVRVGWHDAATVRGALERFIRYDNPERLVIGPWTHGGAALAGPYVADLGERKKLLSGQAAEVMDFLERGAAELLVGGGKRLAYYRYGADEWVEATAWPPADASTSLLYLGPGGTLGLEPPLSEGDADILDVDFSAASGETNRWRTNLGGGNVSYPDRAAAAAPLLSYESAAWKESVCVEGSPSAELWISADREDAALHVYLDAVDSEGQVVYLTEGLIRLSESQERRDPVLGDLLGPRHAHERATSRPLKPGERRKVAIALEPISVSLKRGSRLRLSISGADSSNFERIPKEGSLKLALERAADTPSSIRIPILRNGAAGSGR